MAWIIDWIELLVVFLAGVCAGLLTLLALIAPGPNDKMRDWQ